MHRGKRKLSTIAKGKKLSGKPPVMGFMPLAGLREHPMKELHTAATRAGISDKDYCHLFHGQTLEAQLHTQ